MPYSAPFLAAAFSFPAVAWMSSAFCQCSAGKNGSITVLIDSFDGKRLNSPNDVIVKSDGSIWFTDPTFGLLGNYEGYKAEPEIDANVYRIDGETGKATIVAEGVLGPNGLAFSPDEKILYVVESRGVPNRKILAYDVSADGKQIVVASRSSADAANPLTLVLNWPALLKRR